MKKISRNLLAAFILAFLLPSVVPAEEENIQKWERSSQLRREVKQLVMNENFTRLEDLINTARTNKLRYKNADWVLEDLYNAIPYSMNTHEDIYRFVNKWKEHSPKSNIPDVINARAFKARAWQIRGNATIEKLTENEHLGFREYLKKSWASIVKAEQQGPTDPEICNVKTELSFTLYSDKELAKKNFNKCLEIETGYYPVYFTMLNFLQPKWFGSSKELLIFVGESSRNTQHIDGNGLYALLAYARAYNTDDVFYPRGVFSWERTKSGFQDMMNKYGKAPDILHQYGYLAMLVKDHKTFAKVLAETGTEWDPLKEKYYRSKSWYEYHLNQTKVFLKM